MTPFWGTNQREEPLQDDPEPGDSGNLTEANLSLLKVDDLPDRGEVLHEWTDQFAVREL
jgi:hypothetical protein